MTDAGTYPNPASIDENQLQNLIDLKRQKLIQLEAELASYEKEKHNYHNVQEKLVSLPLKLRSAAMVPLTKVAFMPGELIHTNEILVLLGDGYFVETTAAQANKIVQKRVSLIDSRVTEVQKAVKLARGHVEKTSSFLDETNEGKFREIVETLPGSIGDSNNDEIDSGKRKSRISNSSAEQQRRHLLEKSAAIAESMKLNISQNPDSCSPAPQPETKVDKIDTNSAGPSEEEKKALMDWLDELERQEELQDEYDRQSSDYESTSQEEPVTEAKGSKLSRSVSFADNVDVKEFSKNEKCEVSAPADNEGPQTKSILKPSASDSLSDHMNTQLDTVHESETRSAPKKVTNVFKGTVLETSTRNNLSLDPQEDIKPRRESLFKKRKNLIS